MEESIPVIDLAKISNQEECNKLREACEKWGCFRIMNHSIPATLVEEMKLVIRTLLDRPKEIKMRNTDVPAGSGYIAPGSFLNPLYESLGFRTYGFGSSQLSVQDFCSQLDASPYERKIMEAYGKAIHELAIKLGQKMAESLAIEGAGLEDWQFQFRMNKYHFTQETVGSLGINLHTNTGLLTILQDNHVGGLEVMGNSGSPVAVPPSTGTFIVNLGDVARAWSNGRFRNVMHHVQCKEATKRLSIAVAILAPSNGNVEVAKELVDRDGRPIYQPFDYEDYKKLRFARSMHVGEALELFK